MVEAAAQAIGGEEKCECGGFHTLSLSVLSKVEK